MSNGFRSALVILLGMALACTVTAETGKIDHLRAMINKKLASTDLKKEASDAGQQRALLCSYCHGSDGNSKKPEVPNLAGQNPVYLLHQIEKFASGERKDYVMSSLAKKLTLEDRANLAIFYSSKRVKRVKYNPQLVPQGKKIYNSVCSNCHGERGVGKFNFARLAGQQPQYVIKTLKRFRSNAANPGKHRNAKRSSAIMEEFSKDLADVQIEALASYIAQLR